MSLVDRLLQQRRKMQSTALLGEDESVVVDVSRSGFGDCLCVAWLACGATGPWVKLYADETQSRVGSRQELLDLFDIPSGSGEVRVRISPAFRMEEKTYGHPSRLQIWADRFRVPCRYKRPAHLIRDDEVDAFRCDGKVVSICPHTTWRSKTWPYWHVLYQRLRDCGWTVYIIGVADETYDGYEGNLLHLTWRESAAALLASDLVIAHDSGPGHLGATLGVPTLALCGPSDSGIFRHALNVRCLAVTPQEMPCVGCWWRASYRKAECSKACAALVDLSVDRVLEECDKILTFVPSDRLSAPPCSASFRAARQRYIDDKGFLNTETSIVKKGRFWCGRDNVGQDKVIVNDIYIRDTYKCRNLTGRFPNLVVDVGAHIGAFASLWHELHPESKIVCVEVCPEHIPALRKNVGEFAEVIQGACTYDASGLVLLNTVFPNCTNSGGSTVFPRFDAENRPEWTENDYWVDTRTFRRVTLEEILQSTGHQTIDVLKLACEGSEYSILENTQVLSRISAILGEYHGHDGFDRLRNGALRDWNVRWHSPGGVGGTFCCVNPVATRRVKTPPDCLQYA